MDMSTKEQGGEQQTQHALLVAWGWFAQEIGLLEQMQQVRLRQKRYQHSPQGKVLEFLVAILAGLKHLQEISLAAHPLDKDRVVAQAWGQAGWADYSGVSRTLRTLSWEEVNALIQGLEAVSQPYLTSELQRLQSSGQRLCYDGDLTGLPVSNTSQSYPNAAFGYMDDAIRLGYQAGLVSLRSPTYGRLWLAIAHHPGDTVSCTQASNLVYTAEAKTGLRPLRRTALLRQRMAALEEQLRQPTSGTQCSNRRCKWRKSACVKASGNSNSAKRNSTNWKASTAARSARNAPPAVWPWRASAGRPPLSVSPGESKLAKLPSAA
jgi:hypothetical protein